MKFLVRTLMPLAVASAVVAAFGCGASTTSGTPTQSSPPLSSPSSLGTPTATGKLDPAVAMPPSFPSDFPVYPGARLTQANQATGNGQTTWGMKWETLDGVDMVSAFYTTKLNQGDWILTYNGSSNGKFSAIFSRKSNQRQAGILGVEQQSGATDITLALGVPS